MHLRARDLPRKPFPTNLADLLLKGALLELKNMLVEGEQVGERESFGEGGRDVARQIALHSHVEVEVGLKG